MPGKVNPVIPEVVLQVRRAGDRQRHRDHGRRHAGPVRAQRAHPADRAQPAAVAAPAHERLACVGARSAWTASGQPRRRRRLGGATLAVATALNGAIGYDKGDRRSSRRRPSPGRPLREVALEEGVDAEALRRDDRPAQDRARQSGWIGAPTPRRPLRDASIASSISPAPAFDSGSLRLPHLGDCTHEGQPLAARTLAIRRCASPTSSSKRAKAVRVMPTPPGWPS